MLKRYNWYNIFLHIMLVGLSLSVILLINKNKILSEKLNGGNIGQLKEGDVIQNFSAYDLNKNEILIDFKKGKNKLLFVFTTTCPYCTKNISHWKELYDSKKNEFEIIGIGCDDAEEIQEYVEANKLPYKVLVPKDKDFRKKNKISGVPQTIYLDKSKIEKIYIGLLQTDISNKF